MSALAGRAGETGETSEAGKPVSHVEARILTNLKLTVFWLIPYYCALHVIINYDSVCECVFCVPVGVKLLMNMLNIGSAYS